MSTSEEYRKIAEEYDRLAREAKTESDRLALLGLAENWFENASRQDEMSPGQIAEVENLAREWKANPQKQESQNRRRWWQQLLGVFRTGENDIIR
jgi:hypothetical protein